MPELNLVSHNDIRTRLEQSLLIIDNEVCFVRRHRENSNKIIATNIETQKKKSHTVVNRNLNYDILDNQFVNFQIIKQQKKTDYDFDEDAPNTKDSPTFYTMYLARVPMRQYAYGLTQQNHRMIPLETQRHLRDYMQSQLSFDYLTQTNSISTQSLLKKYPKKEFLNKLVPGDSIALAPTVAINRTSSNIDEIYYKSTLIGILFNNTCKINNKIYEKSHQLKSTLKRIGFNV